MEAIQRLLANYLLDLMGAVTDYNTSLPCLETILAHNRQTLQMDQLQLIYTSELPKDVRNGYVISIMHMREDGCEWALLESVPNAL